MQVAEVPDPVDEHDLLADPRPAYDDRVPRLVALDDHAVPDGHPGHRAEEDGQVTAAVTGG